MSPWGEAARKLTVIYNRKSDVFDHFGSAFNNTKFILFCSFLKISLQTTAADPEILDLDLLTGGGLSYGAIFSIIDGTSYSPKVVLACRSVNLVFISFSV
jgi:hypothetical protein